MNNALNTSRRVRSLYKTIGATVAAVLLAGSLPACKTMENLSDGEKVLVVAGAGILAAIVGKAAQTEKSGSTGSAGGAVVSGDVDEWLQTIDQSDSRFHRFMAYQNMLDINSSTSLFN